MKVALSSSKMQTSPWSFAVTHCRLPMLPPIKVFVCLSFALLTLKDPSLWLCLLPTNSVENLMSFLALVRIAETGLVLLYFFMRGSTRDESIICSSQMIF